MKFNSTLLKTAILLGPILLSVAVGGQEEDQTDEASAQSILKITSQGGSTFERREDGSFTKTYLGGLNATHQDVKLNADEGVYSSDPGILRIFGSASFKDSLRTVNADTVIYFENIRETLAIGNVMVNEGFKTLWADRVRYNKNDRLLDASGSVVVKDDSLVVSMRGNQAVFNDSTGYGVITGNPFLEREDNLGSIIQVTCTDTLETFREKKIIRLWHNVVITKDSLTALSGHAEYKSESEAFVLSDEPQIEYVNIDTREGAVGALHTRTVVNGDTIIVFLQDRRVKGANIIGGAFSTITSIDSVGTLHDRSIIESNDMRIAMENDEISLISADGTAQSYYHLNDVVNKKMFVNNASGDTLNFYFDNGKISGMKIFGYGGGIGKGNYYDYELVESPAESDSLAVGIFDDSE